VCPATGASLGLSLGLSVPGNAERWPRQGQGGVQCRRKSLKAHLEWSRAVLTWLYRHCIHSVWSLSPILGDSESLEQEDLGYL
jgi:hypothetical protein